MTHLVRLQCGAALCLLLTGSTYARGQRDANAQKPVIVSVKHPVDSLGEGVYEHQGVEEKNVPTIPGVLLPPKVLHQAKAHYSKALKKIEFEGEVTVTFVVSSTGLAIDPETNPVDNAEAVRCAIEAIQEYRFAPATLDGKPVAVRIRVVVAYKLRKGLFS